MAFARSTPFATRIDEIGRGVVGAEVAQ